MSDEIEDVAAPEIITVGENKASKAQQTLIEIAAKRIYSLKDDLAEPVSQLIDGLATMRANGMEAGLLAAVVNTALIDLYTTSVNERDDMIALIANLSHYLYGNFGDRELFDGAQEDD